MTGTLFLGCAFLFWFLQFWTPRSGESLHFVPFCSFLAQFLFDAPAIPRVRSWNGISFSFHSFLFLPSSRQGECWQVFRQESVIIFCGIPSHSFLSYVGFNMMFVFECIPFKKSFYYLTRRCHCFSSLHVQLQLTTTHASCHPLAATLHALLAYSCWII